VALACAIIVLALTMCAKVYELVRWPAYLQERDPILPFTFAVSLSIAALSEGAVGLLLLTRATNRVKSMALAWLCCLLILYRTILHLYHPDKPCGCLGTFLDQIGFTQAGINGIAIGSIFLLSICAVILWLSNADRRD
jgi:TRAP-type uncharacterized transport system fused permease subunit